ncbi:YgeY family selenium metabolism-linked hydrolase [Desulfobaculum bizertense]|uniref:YgeY family selenium metabolism-linked hydrolase n=1 Tax=Desulfobaculum bizertense TaxID=376490 RepID=UPI001F46774B|nr:YgeY family selenium metabolism-linked hydrolase [Desulfobaculum bizertense]UIJ38635.1 YgeY family selenium metabolism-linked hydrolase [Desulfobaculum bizertense]
MLDEAQKNSVVTLCQDMIRQASVSGEEAGVAGVLKSFMESNGFDEVVMDRYGSVLGCVKGNKPGPKILFDGHIDTVPVDASRWTKEPFGAEIEDGRMYGRGTSDMKGAVAAMAMAAAHMALPENRDFAGEIYVAGVVHEECFEGVAGREISARVQPDVVVIGEASQLNLKIAQRGRAEIVLETIGKPAHSASPAEGINAVHKMMELVRRVEAIEPPKQDVLGLGTNVLTDIKSAPYPGASVVPSGCRVTYDRRLLVGETKESILAPIQKVIDELSAEDSEFSAKVSLAVDSAPCHTGETISAERFFPAWRYDESEDFIQKTLAGLHEIGLAPKIDHYAFCTNGSHYAGEAGIKTFGFGPSLETLAHTDDEYIELDQLYKAVAGYTAISTSLLK